MNRVKNAQRMLPNRSFTTVDDYEPKGLALTYKNLEANIERYQRSKIQEQHSSDDFEPTPDKNDLMFTTEIDTALPPRAASTLEKPMAFEDRLDRQTSSLLPAENPDDAEFKRLLKKIVTKTQKSVLEIEEKILARIKAENESKGWKKPSAAKVAPLKLLTSSKFTSSDQ